MLGCIPFIINNIEIQYLSFEGRMKEAYFFEIVIISYVKSVIHVFFRI